MVVTGRTSPGRERLVLVGGGLCVRLGVHVCVGIMCVSLGPPVGLQGCRV